ncbi:MAG: hypothetical protein ABL982_23315, partial [Vicinamibacterales bacterium]
AITSGMSPRVGKSTGVAGWAAVGRDRGGRLCFIVADRTAATARRANLAHTRVLSSVIAHELAHLLMPGRSHGRRGIMRPLWNPREFADTLPHAFSSDEARDILGTVARLAASARPAAN